jgi:dTDP-4-amino-4,6-dideoxygalactose transaminase
VARRCLSIPVHAALSTDDVDRIVAAAREAMEA